MDIDTTSSAGQYSSWCHISYHVASTPSLLSRTTLEHSPDLPANFPRTGKWCGDGSSLMVQCENRSFQMFAMSPESQSPPPSSTPSLIHAKTFLQPAAVVDFAWYPGASRHNPPGFCFVASVRDCPVKLLNGTDGRLRASYPIVDHRERYIAPHSLAFNVTADRLYCGFEDAIEIFDVQRPGEGDRLPTTPSKKSKDGLKGIISALAFSYSPEYYAAGSFTPASRVSDNIGLFNESAVEPVLSVGGVAEWERGGVTQLMFNPTRPHILYAAFRRSEKLWSWDLRGDSSIPLCCFSKEVLSKGTIKDLTNQRKQFDVEGTGRWLASGNQLGEIAVYDLGAESGEPVEGEAGEQRETRRTEPTLLYDAHSDAIGAIAFHPLEPLLVSVSGSRRFDGDFTASPQEGLESDSDSSDASGENDVVVRFRERPQPSVRDASIKLWNFKGSEMSS